MKISGNEVPLGIKLKPQMSSDAKNLLAEFKSVMSLEASAITECMKRLEASQVEASLKVLAQTLGREGKIVVTGVGKSGKVGQKIAATLSSTGSLSVFLHPTEGLHGDLGLVTERDCILALSQTGATHELLSLLPSFKDRGVSIISICGKMDSPLVTASTAWIDSSVSQEACPHNLAPTTSTTLMLAVGDALAVTLMKMRGFKSDQFAKNHPGGSLGKRLHALSSTVAELMHPCKPLSPKDSMETVVLALTQTRLGAVLIESAGTLAGIITDGDLKRALTQRDRFFSMSAEEVMTAKPTLARPEMLGSEALMLMENRPSQISVLPVVDKNDKPLGVIRIHDLV